MFLVIVTVHCTIIISTNTPRANDATQTAGSGRTIARESGEMAIAAPVSTTNSMGRRGVNRSDTTPPAIRPNASAAVIAPQAAAPPRCSLATTGPRTEKAPYQAISTTQNWATITHSQVCDRNSDQPSRSSVSMLGVARPAPPPPPPAGKAPEPRTGLPAAGKAARGPAPRPPNAPPPPPAPGFPPGADGHQR